MKVFLVIVVIVSMTAFSMYSHRIEPVKQGFSGTVMDIQWKSSNHGMPLILVENEKKMKSYKFHNSRIILTSNDLQIGDNIIKLKESKDCVVNDVKIKCLK